VRVRVRVRVVREVEKQPGTDTEQYGAPCHSRGGDHLLCVVEAHALVHPTVVHTAYRRLAITPSPSDLLVVSASPRQACPRTSTAHVAPVVTHQHHISSSNNFILAADGEART